MNYDLVLQQMKEALATCRKVSVSQSEESLQVLDDFEELMNEAEGKDSKETLMEALGFLLGNLGPFSALLDLMDDVVQSMNELEHRYTKSSKLRFRELHHRLDSALDECRDTSYGDKEVQIVMEGFLQSLLTACSIALNKRAGQKEVRRIWEELCDETRKMRQSLDEETEQLKAILQPVLEAGHTLRDAGEEPPADESMSEEDIVGHDLDRFVAQLASDLGINPEDEEELPGPLSIEEYQDLVDGFRNCVQEAVESAGQNDPELAEAMSMVLGILKKELDFAADAEDLWYHIHKSFFLLQDMVEAERTRTLSALGYHTLMTADRTLSQLEKVHNLQDYLDGLEFDLDLPGSQEEASALLALEPLEDCRISICGVLKEAVSGEADPTDSQLQSVWDSAARDLKKGSRLLNEAFDWMNGLCSRIRSMELEAVGDSDDMDVLYDQFDGVPSEGDQEDLDENSDYVMDLIDKVLKTKQSKQ